MASPFSGSTRIKTEMDQQKKLDKLKLITCTKKKKIKKLPRSERPESKYCYMI